MKMHLNTTIATAIISLLFINCSSTTPNVTHLLDNNSFSYTFNLGSDYTSRAEKLTNNAFDYSILSGMKIAENIDFNIKQYKHFILCGHTKINANPAVGLSTNFLIGQTLISAFTTMNYKGEYGLINAQYLNPLPGVQIYSNINQTYRLGLVFEKETTGIIDHILKTQNTGSPKEYYWDRFTLNALIQIDGKRTLKIGFPIERPCYPNLNFQFTAYL